MLTKQTIRMYRGSQSELFGIMIVNIAFSEIEPQGMAARATRSLFRYAVDLVLPQPVYAQSCGWGIVKVVGGFVGLVATAPANAAVAPAVAWLAGWAVWTSELAEAAAIC